METDRAVEIVQSLAELSGVCAGMWEYGHRGHVSTFNATLVCGAAGDGLEALSG